VRHLICANFNASTKLVSIYLNPDNTTTNNSEKVITSYSVPNTDSNTLPFE
jgi:hypothetical protein